MNKLIKMATIVAGAGAMLGFAGCGDSQVVADTPDAAIINVLTTIQSGKANSEFLKATCTEDTAAEWGLCLDALQAEIKGATFTVVDKKIDGDRASVFVKQVGGQHASDRHEYHVLKVGGKWKVKAF